MMKAFLSYTFGDDVSAVKVLLNEHAVEIFDSQFDLEVRESSQRSIRDAIKNCDFVVFIYSNDSLFIAFEAGLAVALNKPIFSIICGGNDSSFLLDSTHISALPSEIEKIRFGFGLFFKNLISKRRSISSSGKGGVMRTIPMYGGGEPVPMKSYFNVLEKYEHVKGKGAIDLELFFQQVLSAYSVKHVRNADAANPKNDQFPDFSIWSDELSSVFGNPIVVEVKKDLSPRNLQRVMADLDKASAVNPLGGALVFYDQLMGITAENLPATSNRIFIPIYDFVMELISNGFSSSVKKFRNRQVHSS